MCPAPPWQYITLQTNCSLEEGSCRATRAPNRPEPGTAFTHFTTSGRHQLRRAPAGGTQHPPPHGTARRSQLLRPTSREASNHDRVPGIPAPAPAAGGLQWSAALTIPPYKSVSAMGVSFPTQHCSQAPVYLEIQSRETSAEGRGGQGLAS